MKNRVYNKVSFLLIVSLLFGIVAIAQDEAPKEKKKDKPVRFAWNSEMLIDNQSPLMQNAQTLQMIIHHRFGTFGNGISDLYGIYAPSNIRMGLNYGVTDWLTVGLGTEKNNKLTDLMWKVKLLKQTSSWRIPVDITYVGNVALDGRDEEFLGPEYNFTNRFSLFNQIIISSKITDKLSLMVAGGYAHFNLVDTVANPKMGHDKIGLTFGGRYNFYNDLSFVFEYDQPVEVYGEEEDPSKPNLGLGLEVSTSTHIFQVFASNYSQIINQKNLVYNKNDFGEKEGWLVGFNIIVRF